MQHPVAEPRITAAGGQARRARIVLDAPRACLNVDGEPVPLDRSSLLVLQRLLAEPGAVVGKDELLRAGWPGRRVSENSLPKAVGRLRQALRDPGGERLQVVHGYGYRLVDAPGPSPGPAAEAAPPAPRRWRAILLPCLLAALLAAAWLVFAPATRTPPPASIAVLPFADLSQAQDQQHFSDGLADQLLDRLARVPGLRVAARTSSFAYRGRAVDIPTIGRELGVAQVLEGSVQRSGERLRVTLQLVDARDGFHRWSRTYDRPVDELFAMQDEITLAVLQALAVELRPGTPREAPERGTDNPAAYEQWLRARYVFADDETANRRSLVAYRRAVALDPSFEEAWIGLAAHLGHTGLYADSAEEALRGKQEAIEILDAVLARSPGRADAWLLRGDLRYAHRWEWAQGEADLEQAHRLEGVDESSYLLRLARLRAATGRLDEALALTARLLERDPDNGAGTVRGYHLIGLRRFDEARALLRRMVALYPLDEHAHYYLGLIELLEGRPQAALPHFQDSAHVFRLTGEALAYHALGQREASERQRQLLIARYGHVLPYQAAQVHAWRGEPEAALHWLERSIELREASFMYLAFDPLLDPLRGDPRLDAIAARVNLAPAQVRARAR